MDIVNLKITNFLAIGDAPLIELKDKGLVLIQGVNEDDSSATSNGVGKSSIADALCWALYGATARDESGDAVVNNVAKKNCSVTVLLRDGETSYQITRYRKHSEFKNQTVVLTWPKDGASIDISKGTEKETQEVINGIMGCSLDVFMGTIYAGQEVAPDLPKMTDKQLKMLIEEAAGVERLERAYEIARQKANAWQVNRDRAAAVVSSTSSAIESEKLTLAKESLAAETFELGRPGRSVIFREAAKAHKESAVAIVKQMMEIDTAALTKRSEELASTLAGHSELLVKRNALSAEESNAQSKAGIIAAELSRLVSEGAKLQAKYENSEIEAKKPCSACGKPGDEHDVEDFKTHVAASIKKNAEKIAEQRALSASAEAKYSAAMHALAAFEKKIPDVSELSAEQKSIGEKLREYESLKAKATSFKNQMKQQEELAENAMTEPNPFGRSVDLLKENVEKLKAKLDGAVIAFNELDCEFAIAQSVAKVFSPAGVRAHILDTVTPFLNERTADYLSALSDGNISAVWTTLSKTAKGDLKERFCIEVANEKGANSFKGLSGGEKRKVRLAAMLALQDLVSTRASKPISLYIADEVDDALDAAGLERLMAVLERKARERGTILVISHNDLNCWIDASITVTKRDGLSSIEGYLVTT